MSALQLVLASLTMAVGAWVQGAVGFGSNLLAAPVLVLIDPAFVPGPVTIASLVLNVAVIGRERGAYDRGIGIALAGLVPGTVAAAAVLEVVSTRGLSLAVAGIVLAAVALISSGLDLRPAPPTLLAAGVGSGFMGTVSGIGGPPIALVYQRASGPMMRSTLSRFFLVGGLITVGALLAVGRIGLAEVGYAAALVPGTLAGFAGSGWLARHLDRRTARPAVLGLSAFAAVGVMVRELV